MQVLTPKAAALAVAAIAAFAFALAPASYAAEPPPARTTLASA
jgi:hypothetical protein